MVKYDLLVYLGFIPVFATIIVAAFAIWATPVDVDPEVRKIRVADATLVVFAYANADLRPLSQATRTIPIVFGASAPVEDGYVASYARLGGNITGFTLYEPSMAGKWLAILKEISPDLTRVALLVNPDTAPLYGRFYLCAFEAAAATFSVESVTTFVHNESEIEASLAALGQQSKSGLIVAPEAFTTAKRELLVALAAHYRLPATYGLRQFPTSGGLLSYGPDAVDPVRRAATYIDRILRGESPRHLQRCTLASKK
jgi:putative ABC transport system substrate-binding protein